MIFDLEVRIQSKCHKFRRILMKKIQVQPMTRDDANELEGECDCVFPMTVQLNFVVAGGKAPRGGMAGFDQRQSWRVRGTERSFRREDREGIFANWPAVTSAGRTSVSR